MLVEIGPPQTGTLTRGLVRVGSGETSRLVRSVHGVRGETCVVPGERGIPVTGRETTTLSCVRTGDDRDHGSWYVPCDVGTLGVFTGHWDSGRRR